MNERLSPRIQYCLKEAQHDCFFVVGPEDGPKERIGALKPLLMGDSEPFRAMLQDSEMAEKKDIRLKDVEPETFRNFLKCVYGASNIIIPMLYFEQTAKLLYVVEKYLVNDVKSDLTKHLFMMFESSKLFVALSHPVCYEEERLKKEIVRILTYKFEEVASDDQFLELNYSAIKWILQTDYILAKEVEIWKAVVQWANHQTGSVDGKVLRSQMLGLLKYIRFLSMNHSEFTEHVVSSEILNEEEINDLCRAFVLGRPCVAGLLSNNTSPRFNIIAVPVSKHIICSFMVLNNYAYVDCSVSDVSKLETCSETYCWADNDWELIISKGSKNTDNNLVISLCCKHRIYTHIYLETILINQSGKSNDSIVIKKWFDFRQQQCLMIFDDVIEWNTLMDPQSGFVKNDCITIHVRVFIKV